MTDPRKFLTRFQPASSLRASHLVATDSLKLTAACPLVGNPLNLLLVIVYVPHDCFPSTRCPGRGPFNSSCSLLGDRTRLSAREKIALIERRSLKASLSIRRSRWCISAFFNFYIPCIVPFAKRPVGISNKFGVLAASWRNTSVVMNH